MSGHFDDVNIAIPQPELNKINHKASNFTSSMAVQPALLSSGVIPSDTMHEQDPKNGDVARE